MALECKIKHMLDVHLAEVMRQFITIQDEDFRRAQVAFEEVFEQVTRAMGDQCNYFKKYSRQVLYAGSVYDGTKVSKMNEFDMDIVIKLPVCYDDISIENEQPGFVRMKVPSLDHLDKQPGWEDCHKVLRDWRDSDKYLLQNKIRSWLHGIVTKAINQLEGKVEVKGTTYLVSYKESGPAFTLAVRNERGAEDFQLDVDLVPVIRFMHPRRPKDYKVVEGINVRNWLVVPKPNKTIKSSVLKNRCWRLSFQDHEREMMKGCHNLKNTIRLVKKLRDGLKLKAIASYYIKTLFLWEISESEDNSFWRKRLSITFRRMVEELYDAVKIRTIPYFWHQDNNLLESVKPSVLRSYEAKLKDVLDAIDANDCIKVVSFMLTSEEMENFKQSDFYINVPAALAFYDGDGMFPTSEEASTSELNSLSDKIMADFIKRLLDIKDRADKCKMGLQKELDILSDISNALSVELDTLSENTQTIAYVETKMCDLRHRTATMKNKIDGDKGAVMDKWISLKEELCDEAKFLINNSKNMSTKVNYEMFSNILDRFKLLQMLSELI